MKIGFIGCGNMATAMIAGIMDSGKVDRENVMVSNPSEENLLAVQKAHGIQITQDNREVAAFAEILVLAVKPYLYEVVAKEIQKVLPAATVVVTIAAGISIEKMQVQLGRPQPVIRTMPNTPALVKAGVTAVCRSQEVSDESYQGTIQLLGSFGKVFELPESKMDVVPAISGSAPAYIFMLIEAMADAGVLDGLPRQIAKEMAAQTVLGAAKMVLDTGIHPEELKDRVCTPGGTTIEAVLTLEKNQFRSSVQEAMKACTKKTKEMTQTS
jgi:pyrroline-5-carboxylate reductase